MEQARAANDGKPYSRTNPTTLDQPEPVLIEGTLNKLPTVISEKVQAPQRLSACSMFTETEQN